MNTKLYRKCGAYRMLFSLMLSERQYERENRRLFRLLRTIAKMGEEMAVEDYCKAKAQNDYAAELKAMYEYQQTRNVLYEL